MNTISNKSKGLRLGGLFLLAGTALASVGCDVTSHLFFTVKGKDLEVTFCDRGAGIYSIKYKDTYVTYHPQNQNVYLKNDYYYGKALGRVAGRIKDGKMTVDGKDYQLDINEKDNFYKNNNIHGGKDSITTKNFTRKIRENTDEVTVTFSYLSPSMESGFPEELYCVYEYKISKSESKIDININGTPTGPTPVNLSNHPYFRLGNDGDILNHTITMSNAVSLAKFNIHENKRTDQVVTGEIPLDNTEVEEWDFRNEKRIGKDIAAAKAKDLTSGGYDHIWKFDDKYKTNDIVLKNPNNKISLTVNTDANAVIMYANCYPHENDLMNPSGKDALYAGITIEPIQFFKKAEDLIRTPDNPYQRHISYTFDQTK